MNGPLTPADIYKVYLEAITPDYTIWVLETIQQKLFTFLQREGQNRTLFNEVGKELALDDSVGLLTNFLFYSEEEFIYTGSKNLCTVYFVTKEQKF